MMFRNVRTFIFRSICYCQTAMVDWTACRSQHSFHSFFLSPACDRAPSSFSPSRPACLFPFIRPFHLNSRPPRWD
ncbi:hypothetical protein PO909_032214 [Leuciscus waleckii]